MKKHFTITAIVFFALTSLSWAAEAPMTFSSVDSGLFVNYAVGTYSNYYKTGIGAGAQFNFDITPVTDLGCFTLLNYSYGISNTEWVDSFQVVSLLIGLSYEIRSRGALTLHPELGYGGTAHIAIGDIDRDGTAGADEFVDQSLFFSLKAVYAMNDDFSIFISPKMTAFIENSGLNLLPGYELGARINL